MEVVAEVAKNMVIEKVEIAAEMKDRNPAVYQAMHELFTEEQWIVDASHEDFKEATKRLNASSVQAKLLLLLM